MNADLSLLADELRAIANLGLGYAQNEYDVERYRRVQAISARLAGVSSEPDASLPDNWSHISPAAGAEAVVLRDESLLLIRRTDNGLWAVPGGLVEVGESAAEAAVRELREEAGLIGRATRLLGVFDSRLWQERSRVQFFGHVFLVDAGDAAPVPGPEASDAVFFAADALPPLSPGHDRRVPVLFRLLRGELPVPFFDPG